MNVVTGAFSYSGSYIARELLRRGEQVRSLSRERPLGSHPLAGQVGFGRLQFDDEAALDADLEGADRLFNTYWIRSLRGKATFAPAVVNTRKLLLAAERTGVRRIVHLGVSNSSEDSPLAYFQGKAEVDRLLRKSSISHAIIRPTLIYGREDVLLNNIAWCLRRFPLFLMPGRGEYRLQPVDVEDLAKLAVDAGALSGAEEFDAAGPVTLSFAELVGRIKRAIGSRTPSLNAPPKLALVGASVVGRLRRDDLLTAEELDGLMAELLISHRAPTTAGRIDDWLTEYGDTLGRQYVSERLRNWTPRRE